jgi:hypothetical protein
LPATAAFLPLLARPAVMSAFLLPLHATVRSPWLRGLRALVLQALGVGGFRAARAPLRHGDASDLGKFGKRPITAGPTTRNIRAAGASPILL